jgi:hypothetical protein
MVAAVAAWVDTLRDLGVPTIIGAVLGAAINAVAQARGRVAAHGQALDLLVAQTERDAALTADEGLRRLEVAVQTGQRGPGLLHNDWQDDVLQPARRITNPEAYRRVLQVSNVLIPVIMSAEGENWQYPASRAIDDARDALEAILKRREIPASRFPDKEKLSGLMGPPGRAGLFDALNEWLASN